MTAHTPHLVSRVDTSRPAVALETTLLVHGVPRDAALPLNDRLEGIVRTTGAEPYLIGVVNGEAIVGMTRVELVAMLDRDHTEKLNRANLGTALRPFANGWGATTVGSTCELAAAAGIRVFATGGLGGVHQGLHERLDISGDLGALAAFPVAVVSAGVKSILDVESTRELLEAIAVPVVGYRTDSFPAFYRRTSEASVDARLDEPGELARLADAEMRRTGRGMLVCNPIAAEHELPESDWAAWLKEAQIEATGATGRESTPALLGALHRVSGGATLRANVELVAANVRLAAELASAMAAVDAAPGHAT
ncbi:MAG: pseudouridine-5'-phosphate glycosidase [Planctomycetota bacterium]